MENKYALEESMVYKEIEQKLVVVDINAAKYFTFNETADFIMKRLLENMEYEEIKSRFLAEFDVSDKEFENDFSAFTKELGSKSILLNGGEK
jgi:DNA-directed RNA polymerase delta subunit